MRKEDRPEYFKIYRAQPDYAARHREYQRKYRLRMKAIRPPAKPRTRMSHESRLDYVRRQNWEKRLMCIEKYGGTCKCCGETEPRFLAFDHINGGGHKHRKQVGNIVDWLVRESFPNEIRLLCHNCNQSLGYYKMCPHMVLT